MRTITIKGGTPLHTDSLCRTCYWAHIQRGFRESEELMHCCFSQFRRIPFPVAKCTDYCDKTVPSRHDMERIALTIDPSRARRPAGFAGIGFAASGAAACKLEGDSIEGEGEEDRDSFAARQPEAEPSAEEAADVEPAPAR